MKGTNNVAIGEVLGREHGRELDVTKRYSYGVQNSAKGFIDERAKPDKLVWEIENETEEAQYLVVSPLFNGSNNNTIFETVRNMLRNVVPGVPDAQVHAFQDGLVYKDADDNELNVRSKGGRFINQFLRYIGNSPTRLTEMRIQSNTVGGEKDLTNFSAELTTKFFSPFAQPVENQLQLMPLIKTASNFSPEILDLDFVGLAFPVILSNEHYFVFQVNPGTKLNITAFVGAQNSLPQEFYRSIKKADDIQRMYGLGK